MAKIYGLFGAMTGKLAETVMSVRNGEQIARKYQPVVYNPSSTAQVAQRARFKLLSQMSAVMGPVIAMPRVGMVSTRNLFTKKNFPATSYADQQAEVELTAIKLTNSVVSLPGVTGSVDSGTASVQLVYAAAGLSRVVYIAFSKQTDNTLRLIGTSVVTTAGANNNYATTMAVGADPVVVYAYGVRDNTEAARVKFGEMTVVTAEQIAKVVTSRALTESDITLTETQAVELQ